MPIKTLKILDSNFQQIATINDYEFFQWTRNLRSVDRFILHINRYKHDVDKLLVRNWIIVNVGGNDRAGRIEQRKIGLTQEGKVSEDFIISGFSGSQPILDRYIIEGTDIP